MPPLQQNLLLRCSNNFAQVESNTNGFLGHRNIDIVAIWKALEIHPDELRGGDLNGERKWL